MSGPILTAPVLTRSLITRVAMRAQREGLTDDVTATRMDLTATHMNGCPLNLQLLIEGSLDTLTHDIAGIRRHLDRETGQLTNHFLPRAALPEGDR